ncbi:hypothetical protein CBR_g39652 [Chara braunii]|uniref:Flap endonuclease 1 n=1 Tax=Chara braunii TaxID=69332 RepID=A0A388K1E4_CHABU|nr:hypothetical protein CBR_g39652 [Chara braunii]|eukprot:GBG63871.1 hypothetical protein CBR_g39652 [Chara braunii]
MGIKGLTKLLADNAPQSMKEQKFESYFGRKIAIDASQCIYQFLAVVGRQGSDLLTNEAGEVTSHLQGMFMRTVRLIEAGIKPVYVFDGKPPKLKADELSKRTARREEAAEDLAKAQEAGAVDDIEKYSKRTIKPTRSHNEDCQKLLTLMGVPVVVAPSEAEAECVSLCKAGKVYAVASEDMDSLTFGAPRLLRHLMEPSSKKIPVTEFEIDKVLEGLALTMDQFIDLCILCGCDYLESIKGIGPQTGLKMIRQHGSLEKVIEHLNKDRYHLPEVFPFEEARRLFKEPDVRPADSTNEPKWGSPDEEAVKAFLVDENGFNSERVAKALEKIKAAKGKSSQGRLESFFKPTVKPPPNANAAPPSGGGGGVKRKDAPGEVQGAAKAKGRQPPAKKGKPSSKTAKKK